MEDAFIPNASKVVNAIKELVNKIMSQLVTMPQLGETVTEGTVLRWLVNVGDEVKEDDPILEILQIKLTQKFLHHLVERLQLY